MMIHYCVQGPVWKNSTTMAFSRRFQTGPWKSREANKLNCNGEGLMRKKGWRNVVVCQGFLLPVDPWAPTIDSQSIASQLFAVSLFPYLGFLYFITKSNTAPKLTLFGFYFLLAFVGATIPAGIYAKVEYGTSLSNVDWLHGGAESLLTLTNIFIVLGLRDALRKNRDVKEIESSGFMKSKEEDNPII
ncbi:unnamed protein product [Cuscuta epithymum]|uniref:DUF3593 domain-containing protein n=2 Tax=Cuscuta epithymum TaxID=186058 RepID=A0AAV0EQ10_9ASTE|nr:unnamed protein product [Cuscuta epithymum]CAH9124847.1 unnamed protein product [Cuscuta epithymum]CAH9124848.1 unnamed protein product [Cuscuta epithymum]CAH9124849.1 unnamed protein product [Cuscuta epithymum]CAH9124850.1 unnamed protein product [Cuscuta epithymum]